jgi:signal transduction histidine kinase
VDTLIGGVVHELRNVIFAISDNLEALEVGGEASDEVGETCRALREERDRLALLAGDLVELGRDAPESLTEQPLAPLLAQSVEAAASIAKGAGVSIDSEIEGAWRVRMEPQRLALAVDRMLSSACRHSVAGGCVRVRAEGFTRGVQGWVRLAVRDVGDPLPEAREQAAWEPFSDRTSLGDRLGLAIARRIVAQHGGRVAASSRPDGTELSLELPCR